MIMKKATFLKAIFSLALILGTMSTFAQLTYDATETELSLNVAAGDNYVTISKAIPFVVDPDVAYNPAWKGFTDVGGFTPKLYSRQGAINYWYWSVDGGTLAAEAAEVDGSSNVISNYVNITWGTIGAKTLSVYEKSINAAACQGDPVSTTIQVIAAPSVTIGTASIDQCEAADHEMVLDFTIVEDAPLTAGLGGEFEWNYALTDVSNVDGAGANATDIAADYNAEGLTYTVDASVALTPANGALTEVNVGDGSGAGTGTYTYAVTVATADLPVLNSKPTRYTFDVIGDGNTAGITSRISRKSDYQAGATDYYAVTSNPVAIIIFPKPVTGPIYTRPN